MGARADSRKGHRERRVHREALGKMLVARKAQALNPLARAAKSEALQGREITVSTTFLEVWAIAAPDHKRRRNVLLSSTAH